MNCHEELDKSIKDFTKKLYSSQRTTEDQIESISSSLYFLSQLCKQEELTKYDIVSTKKRIFNVLDSLGKIRNGKILKQVTYSLTNDLAKIFSDIALENLKIGAPLISSMIYELIGDIYIKSSEISQNILTGYELIQLRTQATFWYLKSDQALLKRPGIDHRVFKIRNVTRTAIQKQDKTKPSIVKPSDTIIEVKTPFDYINKETSKSDESMLTMSISAVNFKKLRSQSTITHFSNDSLLLLKKEFRLIPNESPVSLAQPEIRTFASQHNKTQVIYKDNFTIHEKYNALDKIAMRLYFRFNQD